jgi:YD repeat-containing protein
MLRLACYDAENRMISTTTLDGTTTTYQYDGDGRLQSIVEAPTSGTPYPYTTTYAYDVGNNLISVSQSGQTRTFIYDSLNRLYQATNPENGTVTYAYDPNPA